MYETMRDMIKEGKTGVGGKKTGGGGGGGVLVSFALRGHLLFGVTLSCTYVICSNFRRTLIRRIHESAILKR